jgi:NADH-quinone oxidoreductase subunit J
MINNIINLVIGFKSSADFSVLSSLNFILLFKYMILFSTFMTIVSLNPVHSVLYLVFTFALSSLFVICLGAEFLGILLIIVYVGAIAVLFLFIVMMLNIEQEEKLGVNTKVYFLFSWSIVFILSKCFALLSYGYFGVLQDKLLYVYIPSFYVYAQSWVDYLFLTDNILALGMVLYTYYFHLLLIAGLILLLAMVASISLALIPHENSSIKMLKYQDKYRQISRLTEQSVVLANNYSLK